MQIECIADIVRTHSATKPDAVALSLGDRSVSWARAVRAGATGGHRTTGGGGRSHRTALPSSTRTASSTSRCVYGAALGNAVCVDVNWRLAPPEVAFIVNDSAAKVLVVGPDFVPVLDAIARRSRRTTR